MPWNKNAASIRTPSHAKTIGVDVSGDKASTVEGTGSIPELIYI
jgi:hypothetical protein